MPFRAGSIPDEALDALAANRVVILGEMHFLREHRELVAELTRELHARGFRQYLFEWTQAADWLLADYVNDGGLVPEWTPPHDIGGDVLTAIRDLNRTLPESDRIEVHAIDVHLPDYGGTEGWVSILDLLASHLPDQGPIADFVDGDPDYDLSASPANELFRVMNETWPEQQVFLLLNDPLFSTDRVPLNVSGEIYVGRPKRQYDAGILFPLAHRDFVGD